MIPYPLYGREHVKRETVLAAAENGARVFTDLIKSIINKMAACIRTGIRFFKNRLRCETVGIVWLRVRNTAASFSTKFGFIKSAAGYLLEKGRAAGAQIQNSTGRITSRSGTLWHALKNKRESSDEGALRNVRTRTIAIGRTLRLRTAGKATLIAKVSLSTFCVLAGITALLLSVYTIIPSVVSDISHFFEEDIAEALYKRTLKDRELAAFEQPLPDPHAAFIRGNFVTVQKENPDIIGRLSIDALQLGYLVVQTDNNDYYQVNGYNRKKSNKGAMYLDSRCNANAHPPQGHYLIYGRSMTDGSMFGSLHRFCDAAFFESCRTIRFDTLYDDFEWEVFSVYYSGQDDNTAYTPYTDAHQWLFCLQQLSDKSLFQTDAALCNDDVLLTLCTIPDHSGTRCVVHARLVR